MKYIYSLLLCLLALISCNNPEYPTESDILNFLGSVKGIVQTKSLLPLETETGEEVTVIAPGYGDGTKLQTAQFSASAGELTLLNTNPIKRSGTGMSFTAWIETDGVSMEEGTVDFKSNLENFIGANYKEEALEVTNDIAFEFSHLVAKVSLEVYNIAQQPEEQITGGYIVFPAIKRTGNIAYSLLKAPIITPGKAGEELEVALNASGETQMYLPPLNSDDLLMYGSFTVMVGATSYVGTLDNLKDLNPTIATDGIKAGDHIVMRIDINDDHTTLLQAITLAPWEKKASDIYNRDRNGIWGIEDLQALAMMVNTGSTSYGGYLLEDLYQVENGEKMVRLYTDLNYGDDKKFIPIGTVANPFDMIFDGNGYTISNINYTGTNNTAMFGVIKNAQVMNLTLRNTLISGGTNVGSIVGLATGNSIVDHCLVYRGRVLGDENTGGFVGHVSEGSIIRNCRVELDLVSGHMQTGGFVGSNSGTIGNSASVISTGVACTGNNAGGFAGRNYGKIENAYTYAYITVAPSGNDALCGAWVGDNGMNEGINSHIYWNNDCIDNGYCYRVIGDAPDLEGIEQIPSKTTYYNKYDKNTGRLINSKNEQSTMLKNRLNEVSNSRPEYLNWAKIYNSHLPVFSY
ncbi:hypothetical protein LJB85_03815 [Porphyromonadaceae bacterium OttesenSCG-928-L07]|nr:hypothetical protein [Porphyromonadaceae bacterium OttesenSCG-928-L07]MDL2251403.1 hypothetical protein [Odoribacter sp. OttesenSCG-928-J03]MDL2330612.1 hypothetical protein [Odoribacter sp. OttesenSCG-928-A06]